MTPALFPPARAVLATLCIIGLIMFFTWLATFIERN